MASALPALAVAAFLATLGLLVFWVRPRHPLNQTLGILLALRASVGLQAGLLAGAPTPEDALVHARTLVWYALPAPLLVLLLGRHLEGTSSRAWQAAAWGLGGLTLAGGVLHVAQPGSFVAAIARLGETYTFSSGPLTYALAASESVLQAWLVVQVARRAAREPRDTPRLQLAVIGVAFAFVLLHAGGFFLTRTLARPEALRDLGFAMRALATLAAAGLALAVLPRLARALPARARAPLGAAWAALGLLGAADGLLTARPALLAWLPGYETSLLLVRALFAAGVAFALVRFGLAAEGAATRARARLALQLLVLAWLGIAALGLAVLVAGANPLALGLGAAAALLAHVSRIPRRLARRALLEETDPRAARERARAYAQAVHAARAPEGGVTPEGERLLRALRDDLGIGERDHEILLAGLTPPEPARDGEGMRFHRFVLEQELGRGASGSVHLARTPEGDRVVLKRYRAGARTQAALEEARALLRVRHPRVVAFLEVGREGSEVFLVMAHAPGGSAADRLRRDGPLPPAEAVRLVADLLEGLGALHAAGLVHRDVKPENLLLDAQGRGLVGDLGSARFTDEDSAMTGIGGSLSSVSPEALRRHAAGPASDLYGAAATLYRLLTGQHHVALEGADVFEARERILLDPPRLPHPRVPPALEAPLRWGLAKSPLARPGGAAQLRALLLSFLEDQERAADAQDVARTEGAAGAGA